MKILDGRESFYQWDLNQKITSANFKVGDEIHFYNVKQPKALVLVAYELNNKVVVDVPNILLQSSLPITVYRYINQSDTSSTVDQHQIEVIQRPKPDDYVYTETEIKSYEALDKRITKLEESGGGSVTPEQIQEAVNEYLEENPIEMTETDPTVPKWAKQQTKPTYNANEVGAYSKIEIDTKVNSINEDIDKVESQTEIIKSDVESIQQRINEEAHFRGYLSTNAKIQSMEATPNDFAYSAESGTKWVYDAENDWQDTGTPVPDQLTPASNALPLINGVATAGQSEEYARGDHRHPTDTTRVSVEEFNKYQADIETALDTIIAIQNELIGGDSE